MNEGTPSKNKEMQRLLSETLREIEHLRRQNEVFAAQMFVVETFADAMRSPQRPAQGAAVDIAWQLRRELNRLVDEAE